MIIWDKQDKDMNEVKQAVDDFIDTLHQEAVKEEDSDKDANKDLPLSKSFTLGK